MNTCPCNSLRTSNSFARCDTGVVIGSKPHLSCTRTTSFLFAPLDVRVHTGYSAFPFGTPTKPFRGYIFQKLILAWKFSCINKNCFFVKETDTFGHIVVWTTYTSHIDHFTSQHTAFEQSAACLSVFLELLPGLIPLTMLWHAGWT